MPKYTKAVPEHSGSMLGHLLLRADGGRLVGSLGAGGGVVELVVVAVGERVVGGQGTTDG